MGLFLRNQAIKAFAIPRLAKVIFGRDIADTIHLPQYLWPVEPGNAHLIRA
jgi:hypothetical protein